MTPLTPLTDEQRGWASDPKAVRMAEAVARRASLRAGWCPGAAYEDLLSAALLGLCQAAGRYDPARGVGFAAFARPRVVGAVADYLSREAARGQGWGRGAVRAGRVPKAVPLGDGPAGARGAAAAPRAPRRRKAAPRPPDGGGVETVEEVVRRHVLATLARFGGNKLRAAAALGVCPKTLYNKLARWGVEG